MPWLSAAIDALSTGGPCGYRIGRVGASEPTALAALALIAHGHSKSAGSKLHWLADLQAADGSVGVMQDQPQPGWPTSLAVLAWYAADTAEGGSRYARNVYRATRWLLEARGTTFPRSEQGHNSLLAGWPWVLGTHSWLEPTAWAVLALRKIGKSTHPRTREGAALLMDRILSCGGGNYGNTVILGQQLRPHIQPSGLMMMALAGEPDSDSRVSMSLDYLETALEQPVAPASLSYAMMGLAAGGRSIAQIDTSLAAAAAQSLERRDLLELALLSLASLGVDNPLLKVEAQ